MDPERWEDLQVLIRTAGSRRLPSVRALAARWRISPTTVLGMLREARRRGWIETRAGGGSWAAGCMPRSIEPAARRGFATVTEELREGIRSGRWGGGERIPPTKHLAAKYAVHAATVRKALLALAETGALKRQGQTWNVAPPRRRAGREPTLLCLGAGDGQRGLRLDSDREWDFWREIQAEATRNGLVTEIRSWAGRLPDQAGPPLGAVVSTWHVPDPRPMLSALHRARIPTAVWLESPVLSSGNLPFRSPWIGFHDLAYGHESGKVLAAHPTINRHQRIAWISPFHGAEWSRNRLDGLRRGLPPGVFLHEALGPWLSEWDFQEAVWKDPKAWRRIRLEGIGSGIRNAELARPLMEAMGRQRLLDQFAPKLDAALAADCTLWVTASDWTARICLDWLSDQKIRVPGDLAVAGFDDSREAFRLGLTSLRFDTPAMARAMVRQVLSPQGGRRGTIRYAGAVVVRGSTPATG